MADACKLSDKCFLSGGINERAIFGNPSTLPDQVTAHGRGTLHSTAGKKGPMIEPAVAHPDSVESHFYAARHGLRAVCPANFCQNLSCLEQEFYFLLFITVELLGEAKRQAAAGEAAESACGSYMNQQEIWKLEETKMTHIERTQALLAGKKLDSTAINLRNTSPYDEKNPPPTWSRSAFSSRIVSTGIS